MPVAAAASQAKASAIMKTETERHMLPRFSALGLAVSAVLTVMVAAVASAQAPYSKEELAAGIRTSEFTRYAPAGQKLQLYTLTALDVDCKVKDITTDIVKTHEHGAALVEDIEHFTYFSKDNARHKCNEKKIRGPMLTYRAEPGYTGADNLEVLIINNEGFAHRYIFTIKVVAAKSRR